MTPDAVSSKSSLLSKLPPELLAQVNEAIVTRDPPTCCLGASDLRNCSGI